MPQHTNNDLTIEQTKKKLIKEQEQLLNNHRWLNEFTNANGLEKVKAMKRENNLNALNALPKPKLDSGLSGFNQFVEKVLSTKGDNTLSGRLVKTAKKALSFQIPAAKTAAQEAISMLQYKISADALDKCKTCQDYLNLQEKLNKIMLHLEMLQQKDPTKTHADNTLNLPFYPEFTAHLQGMHQFIKNNAFLLGPPLTKEEESVFKSFQDVNIKLNLLQQYLSQDQDDAPLATEEKTTIPSIMQSTATIQLTPPDTDLQQTIRQNVDSQSDDFINNTYYKTIYHSFKTFQESKLKSESEYSIPINKPTLSLTQKGFKFIRSILTNQNQSVPENIQEIQTSTANTTERSGFLAKITSNNLSSSSPRANVIATFIKPPEDNYLTIELPLTNGSLNDEQIRYLATYLHTAQIHDIESLKKKATNITADDWGKISTTFGQLSPKPTGSPSAQLRVPVISGEVEDDITPNSLDAMSKQDDQSLAGSIDADADSLRDPELPVPLVLIHNPMLKFHRGTDSANGSNVPAVVRPSTAPPPHRRTNRL
jgi:hypothetical protein